MEKNEPKCNVSKSIYRGSEFNKVSNTSKNFLKKDLAMSNQI